MASTALPDPMSRRPATSLYIGKTSPRIQHAILSLSDTESLLARLDLPTTLADSEPSLDLLSQILMAWHTHIPYDSSSLHVKREDWDSAMEESRPIVLGTGDGMELGVGNFERISKRYTGGYCYAQNTLCAAFLRGAFISGTRIRQLATTEERHVTRPPSGFGYRVTEVGARVYLFRGKDPVVEGYNWSCITHELLIVDWAGSDSKRYVLDAGFGGGGCPYPIVLEDGATSRSLTRNESFLLRKQAMGINSFEEIHDPPSGWTLYRRVLPRGSIVEDVTNLDPSPGYWSPCVHFTLESILPSDVIMAEYYNSHAPAAPFMVFFVVSILLPTGARKTLSYGAPPIDLKDGDDNLIKAKLYTKDGVKGEEENVEFIPFETGPIRKVLEREFGFRF
ncbi:BZ3500_MvSof-1268-A1-R1_Chr4-4g07465 [Microbotryum saponariae]|uniref:BZ3500_MvSof-1268-A1-R1_Chr4-4g07465 protein n=1 Tax=Microbotryum saponariae TaxID=289078 RepID=A0A2X0KRG3_9BASI|nr:BZ3500_MvSof-1268-A1-R1_Chr4-4g07465 [Microbotryum saponariae]SDA07126.1 BZ3501_MvSof-1269-A2-R1_Chr4-3g07173 [Microbotryum saponariae]